MAALLPILALTLTPTPGAAAEAAATPPLCLVCGTFGLVDVLCNVALFLPFGWVLRRAGRSPGQAMLWGLGLSVVIEASQFSLIPGRDASLSDLLTNTFGTLTGALLAARSRLLLRPRPSEARHLAGVAGVGLVLICLATSLLVLPAPSPGPWFGQVQPELARMDRFAGEVTAPVLAGAEPLPNSELNDAARARMRRTPTLAARVRPAAHTAGVAPIVAIFDARGDEQAMLAARGADLTFRLRLRSADLRLGWPALRLADGLPRPGETATISGLWTDGQYRLISTAAGGAGETTNAVLGPSWGWRLILPFSEFTPTASQACAAGGLWLGALFLPLCWYLAAATPHVGTRVLGFAAGVVLGLVVAPILVGLPVTPVALWSGPCVTALLLARRGPTEPLPAAAPVTLPHPSTPPSEPLR